MNAADVSRREFLAQAATGMAGKSNRLLIDTHLEVWTIDPRFPFHHPEHSDAKPEIGAPIENEVEDMHEYGLRYAVLINPRLFVAKTRSLCKFSSNKERSNNVTQARPC
jgi:hypothetical protein